MDANRRKEEKALPGRISNQKNAAEEKKGSRKRGPLFWLALAKKVIDRSCSFRLQEDSANELLANMLPTCEKLKSPCGKGEFASSVELV